MTKEPPPKDGTDGDGTPDGEAATVVRLAMEDLAHRLDVPADTISLVAAEPVDWPDTSLGNPQPGEFYATVITPGYRVVLSTMGAKYLYHTDGKRVALVE